MPVESKQPGITKEYCPPLLKGGQGLSCSSLTLTLMEVTNIERQGENDGRDLDEKRENTVRKFILKVSLATIYRCHRHPVKRIVDRLKYFTDCPVGWPCGLVRDTFC